MSRSPDSERELRAPRETIRVPDKLIASELQREDGRFRTWFFYHSAGNEGRRYYARRALIGESGNSSALGAGFSVNAIVLTHRSGHHLFIQRVMSVSEQLAKECGTDRGEEAARQLFLMADNENGLLRESLFIAGAAAMKEPANDEPARIELWEITQ